MASYRKDGKVWRVQVRRGDVSKSATFSTKAEAQAWAGELEAEILAGKRGAVPDKPFRAILERYAEEVSPTKRGERWEVIRLAKLANDPIARVRLPDLRQEDFAAWRDRRLREVSPDSVRREWNLLSACCTIALREWHWLHEHPMRGVRLPPPGRPRDRTLTDDEIERLLYALGYDYDAPPETQTARVGAAMLFALETGMRAGELLALRWDDVESDRRFLRVVGGKTAAARREVPLSTEALRLLEQLRGGDDERVFALSSTAVLDALFRKAKARAQIEDLHFHDTRATAVTRLAKRLDILSLARMIGHKDLRMLQVYFRETAEELAGKLG